MVLFIHSGYPFFQCIRDVPYIFTDIFLCQDVIMNNVFRCYKYKLLLKKKYFDWSSDKIEIMLQSYAHQENNLAQNTLCYKM